MSECVPDVALDGHKSQKEYGVATYFSDYTIGIIKRE